MLPNTLLYIVDRLASFSTNTFRLNPNGSSTATANNIVTFDLPSNSILNLKTSFKVFFKAALTGTTARLPADIHSLIERVEVSAGGVMLSQGSNFFNVLHMAKKAVCCDTSGVSPLAHTEIVRAKSYFDGTTITGTNPESPAGFLCWSRWDDTFLGSAQPSFLDTSLFPDLRVQIYLSPDAVLSSSTGSTLTNFVTAPTTPAASYTLSEISANIECVSMPSGLYDDMVNTLMEKGGFLEIPYKTIHSFNGLHTGSTRFSVSSQSLDRVWLAWRASTYSTLGAPSKVAGFKGAG
eukprot:2599962-Pleurochrysis_carterae.AAC.1